MTTKGARRPRLAEETRKLMWDAAMRAATEKDAPGAKRVAGDLQRAGHTVSDREVQRTFARARASLETSSEPWHFDNATSVEELDLILPVIAARIDEGRDPAITTEEARIILAIRRAAPEWDLRMVDQFARNYRAVRHGNWPGPQPPWDVESMEAFIALAHRDRSQPGTLQKAIDAGRVPSFGFVRVRVVPALDGTGKPIRKGGKR